MLHDCVSEPDDIPEGPAEELGSDAAATGDATDKLTVTGPEGTEKIEVNEAFEIRMTNTTAFE